ncbi:branched-chain amino acid ABC transporter permease [Natronomonas gomsonensis]|jgi:branched-chain amino acid transport system permease protein|uniref:branched-chain amino acid ABC transporter permease n=1 Tax=Natronomonas gomsonensis TaxID=1046043 RepID=UPI0020CA4173|nr:branched-chain amino acid ABC transporter permease [Natronomonas gomsonensis]MCY4732410.1 branched-chain amino acid ABC transporter permease [Natronomonas gomsonensis]
MDVAETYSGGRRLLIERPAVALLGVALLYLFVDLVLRLANVPVELMGVEVIGGTLAVSTFGRFLLDGLIVGLVVGLAGVGLSMTYSILNFANFAHGDYVTTGAFSGWIAAYLVGAFTLGVEEPIGRLLMIQAPSLVSAFSSPLAIVVGIILAGLGAVATALFLDRIVYRPMRDKGGIPLLIASIGVALALRYAIVFIFGTGSRGVTATGSIPQVSIPTGDGTIPLNLHEGTLIVAAIVLMFGIHFLLQRTKLGKAMRAMADNKDLAQVTGIPTERVIRATWIIGGALAGIAGFLIVLERGTLSFNIGWRLLLLIFAGVILGGIGSVYGAMAGGIIIGIASRISLVWIPSDFARVAAFSVMILVLLYRPEGLFGGVKTA